MEKYDIEYNLARDREGCHYRIYEQCEMLYFIKIKVLQNINALYIELYNIIAIMIMYIS